jgi:hypothetical protein
VPIFFWQKNSNPNCKHIKVAQNTDVQKAVQKTLVKLPPRLQKPKKVVGRKNMALSVTSEEQKKSLL